MRPHVFFVRHWRAAVFLCCLAVRANAWTCTEMVDVGGSMSGTELKFKCSQDLSPGETKGDEFRCKDGPCIYAQGLCNHVCDCDDRSDEAHCEATTTPEPSDINGCWVSQTTPTGNAFFINDNQLMVDGKAVTTLIRVSNNRFATLVDGQLEKKVAEVKDGTIQWGNQDVWIPGPIGACATTTLTTTLMVATTTTTPPTTVTATSTTTLATTMTATSITGTTNTLTTIGSTTTTTITSTTWTSVTATIPTTATTVTTVTYVTETSVTTSLTTSVTTSMTTSATTVDLLGALATTVTTTTTPLQMPSLEETLRCAQKDVVYDPIDMIGQHLTIEPNISACLFRCRKTPGCAHFSYWIPGSHCHVQDAFANPEPDRLLFVSAPAGCVSGAGSDGETVRTMLEQKACFSRSRSYAPYVGSLKNHPLHEEKIAEDVLHCQELCLNKTWCHLFEFNVYSDLCHLMEDPPKPVEVAGDYLTSGPPVCPGHIYFTVTLENLDYDQLKLHPELEKALKQKIEDVVLASSEQLNDDTVLDQMIQLRHGHKPNQSDGLFTGHETEVKQIDDEKFRWNCSTEAHVAVFNKKGIDFATQELKSTSRFSIEQKLTAALAEMESTLAPVIHPQSSLYVAAVSPIKAQADDTLRGVAQNGVTAVEDASLAWQHNSMDDVKGRLASRSAVLSKAVAWFTLAAGVFMLVGLYLAVVSLRGRTRLLPQDRRALSATGTYCPLTASLEQASEWDSPLRAPSTWGARKSRQARQIREDTSERSGLMSLEDFVGAAEHAWET